MEKSEGFPPIANTEATILVLGSLPGRKSLLEKEYYAHPRNVFWPVMREIFGVAGSYEQRCQCLMHHRIAVWDVLKASVRPGSMDADIRQETASANDMAAFLEEHPGIRGIAFNGQKAAKLFRDLVPNDHVTGLRSISLPSTSPAYAAMPFEGKLELWNSGLIWLQQNG
jgi:double-stranded uracil-DNA glycosylase